MRWIKRNPFVLSANLHAGAVVASKLYIMKHINYLIKILIITGYPFDDSSNHRSGFYSASPDDDFFRYVSSIYAQNHPKMKNGRNCGDK